MANIIRSADGKRIKTVRAVPLGGMKPDFNPGNLAPTDFINLENIRRVGGEVVSRGGQAAFVNLEGEATGMVDFQTADGTRQLFLEAEIGFGYGFVEYNREFSPKTQARLSGAMLDNTSYSVPLWPTRIHLEGLDQPNVDGLVAPILPTDSTLGNPAIAILGAQPAVHGISQGADYTVPPTVLFKVTPSPVPITNPSTNPRVAVIQGGNYLYICRVNVENPPDLTNPVTVSIFQWDGITLRKEYEVATVGIAPTTIRAVAFRDSPVFYLGGSLPSGADIIAFWLLTRSDSGAWSLVPGPPVTGQMAVPLDPSNMVSYRDRLYFLGGSTLDIFSFDGATITKLPPATTGVPNLPYDSSVSPVLPYSLISDLAVLNGGLYYVWVVLDEAASPIEVVEFSVGRFDGTTWTAEHKDMWVQFVPWTSGSIIFMPHMAAFGGNLIVTGLPHDAFLGDMFYLSPGITTDGFWTEEDIGLTPGNHIGSIKVL